MSFDMDYDKIFEDDIERKFFYTDYPGSKMVVGRISLENAMARLNKDEYYTLVTYSATDTLPEQYKPLTGLTSEDGTLFATADPAIRKDYICRNGGIQMIGRLNNLASGSPNYLLGPGPDTVSLEDIIMEQYDSYQNAPTATATSQRAK